MSNRIVLLASLLAIEPSAISRPMQLGDQPGPIRLDVSLVQLSVTVTDNNGRPVPALPVEAFRLFVDGKPQAITLFRGEDAPVTAGIVVDNSASMASKKTEVVTAALAFAHASNPLDEMFVVHFSDRIRVGLPADRLFTSDISELEAAVSRFDLGGTTALYDALKFSETRVQQGGYLRRVLMVITDGADNSSLSTLDSVISLAQSAGISIFTIGIVGENDPNKHILALTQLAESTGSEAFFPSSLAETTPICQKIAREVRMEYTLGFPGAEDGKYHHIELKAHLPGDGPLQVRTRPGYFALKH